MLAQTQLLWLILLLTISILLYLVMGRSGEFYSNFSAQKHHWSARTGKNLVWPGEDSGFPNDSAMMPYEVYSPNATFTNLLAGDQPAPVDSAEDME